MAERYSRLRSNQIYSIKPDDVEATNARVDNYIPSFDEATGKFTWVINTSGASNIEDLGDVDFDSGTPIDGHSLIYDTPTSKWKADYPSLISLANTKVEVVVESGDNEYIRFIEENSEIARFTDGKLGIGETVPAAKLDLNGDLILQNGTSIDEFSTDGTLAGNSDDACPTEKAVKTYSDVIDAKTVKNQDNTMINAFRIAVNGSLTQFNMVDGIVDEYEDESGIDTVNSLNEDYDSVNDLYKPTKDSLTTSPYAHYKCNDNLATTVVIDDGTGSNNGVANVNTSNLSVAGKINNAFELNGTTEYINVDALEVDIDSDTSGSISVWFEADVLDATRAIFTLGDTDAENYFRIAVLANDTVQVTIVNTGAGGAQWTLNSGTILVDTYYHLVITHDGTAPKMYLNSVDVTNFLVEVDKTFWFSDISTAIDNGRIGCFNAISFGNIQFFDGEIDDFRYYQNKALTQAEINAIYNEGTGTEDDQPTGSSNNMTLISDTFTAEAEPDEARIVLLEEDVDAITLNSDIKIYATRDGGSNWVQGTLSDEGDYDASKRILVADFTLTGTGTSMEYKITTHGNHDLKIHATALNWD